MTGGRPRLSVVVISRNEEARITACLTSVLDAVRSIPGTTVILVDSDSSDRTVELARGFPVTIYRYRGPILTAAAGRRIGFDRSEADATLFVDGDCRLHAGWPEEALAILDGSPDVGVVYGAREERLEGDEAFDHAGPAPEEYGLGGNALYRTDAVREAGGFNPFLRSEEEAELLARIRRSGFRERRTKSVMITHSTRPKASWAGFVRRIRSGMVRGYGQVLRVSLGQGLFLHHAHRFNRYLLVLGYLVAGAAASGASLLRGDVRPAAYWLAVGAVAFFALALKRRSLASAAYIVADWLIVAVHLPAGFFGVDGDPNSFRPDTERLN